MYKFAKVFQSNGREVLIMKGKTDVDGVETPRLSIITHFDCGKQLDAGMVLSGGTFEQLDGIFDAADQSTADAVTEFITPGLTPLEYLMNLKAEFEQHEVGELQAYQTADGDMWGLWVHGHVDPNLLLSEINAYNVRNDFEMISTSEIEHAYAFSDDSKFDDEFTMGIVAEDHPNAFKITWVNGDKLIAVDEEGDE